MRGLTEFLVAREIERDLVTVWEWYYETFSAEYYAQENYAEYESINPRSDFGVYANAVLQPPSMDRPARRRQWPAPATQ